MAKTCMIISHTHWDREWYEPFQRFRLRLVHLLDSLLAILARDPAYRYFTLDGQTIVLDDYLEIRPEREEELRRHVEEGRLLIGPWYVLADEALVSGEALVRNLLVGERESKRFGAKMAVGYIPDPFGHISQMPQILRGFGIDNTVLARGVGDRSTELLWESPDGSTVLLCNLRDSYDNAARLPTNDETAFVHEVRRLCASLEPHAATEHLLLMNGTDHMEPQAELPHLMRAACQHLPDMQLVHGTLPMYIDAVKRSLGLSATAGLDRAQGKLQTIRGELRSPQRRHLLPGVLSTRTWIKQRNDRIQNLLEKWTEPFAALACILTGARGSLGTPESAFALVWQAWKYLLQNQPHDSICGCSVDQTHREMVTRFDWAEQIGEEVALRSLHALAEQIQTHSARVALPYIPVTVFNPLATERTDIVEAGVQVPGSLEQFKLLDAEGQAIPHQVLSRRSSEFASLQLGRNQVLGLAAMVEMVAGLSLSVQEIHVQGPDANAGPALARLDVTLVTGGRTDPQVVASAQQQIEALLADESVQVFQVRAHQATSIEFSFVAQGIPGCGYKTYFLAEDQNRAIPAALPVVGTGAEAQTNQPALAWRMENEFLAVEVTPRDGTFSVTHKPSAATYVGLHRFVDGGDRGDEYNYCPPENDLLISAPVNQPHIRWIEQGPARWTIEIEQVYAIPKALTPDRSGRNGETLQCPITSRISLSPGIPRVDICTDVDNLARDHRLRVLFPTQRQADCSSAESAFDVVRRPLGMPSDTAGWAEQPVATHPQQTFVDVSDGHAGLLVANRGLPEYEVIREADGTASIALTLLRCVGWLSRDDFPCREGHAGPALETPEAQCLGRGSLHYSLVPHAGSWQDSYTHAHAFHSPMRAIGSQSHDGILPTSASLIRLEGRGLVLSAIKAAEDADGLIVRVYNITPQPSLARLSACRPIRRASLVTLAEQGQAPIRPDAADAIEFEVRGNQIVSLRLQF